MTDWDWYNGQVRKGGPTMWLALLMDRSLMNRNNFSTPEGWHNLQAALNKRAKT